MFNVVIPFGLIAAFTTLQVNEKLLKQITAILSATISFPILISDLFVFGQSTYLGNTAASFFSWFTGIYETVEPRRLACKFFFNEGNTIGILLFMLLPLLYYFFSRSKERKGKISWAMLIIVQSLSMLILVDAGSVAGRVFDPDRLCRTLSL